MTNCKHQVGGKFVCKRSGNFYVMIDGKKVCYCDEHKPEGALANSQSMCEGCGEKSPSYNIPGKITPRFCGDCIPKGTFMIGVKSKPLREEFCAALAQMPEDLPYNDRILGAIAIIAKTKPKTATGHRRIAQACGIVASSARLREIVDAEDEAPAAASAADAIEPAQLARVARVAKIPAAATTTAPEAAAILASLEPQPAPARRRARARQRPSETSEAPAAPESCAAGAPILSRTLKITRACTTRDEKYIPDAPPSPPRPSDEQPEKAKYAEKMYCVKCLKSGAHTIASFGFEQGVYTHCVKCCLPGMRDVKHKRCAAPGCEKQASYFSEDRKISYCADHRPSDDFENGNKKCEHEGCKKHASCGFAEDGTRRFCDPHKLDGMVNIGAILCETCGIKRASFAQFGFRRPRWCADCVPKDAVSTDKRKCQFPGCDLRPTYGAKGSDVCTHCARHAEEGMETVGTVKCDYPGGCEIVPTFGRAGERATRCKLHKESDMKDMRHKGCPYPGCTKRGTFRSPTKRGMFCLAHKPADAETENKKCRWPGCVTRAQYGLVFGPAIFCGPHAGRAADYGAALYRNRRPKCRDAGCKVRPTMTVEEHENLPTHCEAHAPEGAREVAVMQCSRCHVMAAIDTTSRLCGFCEFGERFGPGAMHKVKEDRLFGALCAEGIPPTTRDRVIDYATICGVRKRPDNYYDCGSYALIIECDEHQHAREFMTARVAEAPAEEAAAAADAVTPHPYSCDCEYTRMVAIHQVVGLPLIFIRYNPDKYTDAVGNRSNAARDDSRDVVCARYAHRLMNYLREDDRAMRLNGLYVLYLYYDGMTGSSPDGYHIDYIDHTMEPWNPIGDV